MKFLLFVSLIGFILSETEKFVDGGNYDLIIVGGGLSGMASALYALKKELAEKVLILEARGAGEGLPPEDLPEFYGGSLDTIDMYGYQVPFGYHSIYMVQPGEDAWVTWGFTETIGEIPLEMWDRFDPESNYFIFPLDGENIYVPVRGGFLFVGGRRRSARYGEVLCIYKDGTSEYVDSDDECPRCTGEGECPAFRKHRPSETFLTNTEAKFMTYLDHYVNKKPMSERRVIEEIEDTEQGGFVVPWFILYLIQKFPASEMELWQWFEYTMGVYYGMIPTPNAPGEVVVNANITHPLIRKIFKIPLAAMAAADINSLKYDPNTWIGFLFYQMLSTGNYYHGGINAIKKKFVVQIRDLGGEMLARARVTKFMVEYMGDPKEGYEPTGECPVSFSKTACRKECKANNHDSTIASEHALRECERDCRKIRDNCRGIHRAYGVIVNDDTKYYSSRIITTATFSQNYDLLIDQEIREFYNYDDLRKDIVETTTWFLTYAVEDGSPDENGFFATADFYIVPEPLEIFGESVFKVTNAESLENYVAPFIAVISSRRDKAFDPTKTWVDVVAHVPKAIWEPFVGLAPHDLPEEYFALKDKIETYLIEETQKVFPALTFERKLSISPLGMSKELGHGYKYGALSYLQDTPRSEDRIPRFHMRGIDNIFIGGSDQIGAGFPIVVNAGIYVIQHAYGLEVSP